MSEIWKPVAGYEGIYDISNKGRVRSYYIRGAKGGVGRNPKMLYLSLSQQGYPIARLHKDGRTFCSTVSRLVLEAFIGPPPAEKPYACHNNGNPLVNTVENLRWGSNSDNQSDRDIHGTSNLGSRNGKAILTEDIVRRIKLRMLRGETNSQISLDHPNVDISAISAIRIGRNWSHVKASRVRTT